MIMDRVQSAWRRVSFSIIAGVPVWIAGGAAHGADPQLVKGARVATDIGGVDSVSADGQASTIIFDSLNVSTNPGTNMPLVVSRTATVNVPIKDNDQAVNLIYDIRGFVLSDKSAHAALVIRACG